MSALEFRIEGGKLHGLEEVVGYSPDKGPYKLYLGSAPIEGVQSVTDALGEFNLRTAIAPGEWEEQTLAETAALLQAIHVYQGTERP